MNEMKRKPELIAEMIREAQTIAVVSHVNPDGDTLACATAMRLGLLKLGKEVSLFCDGKIPDQLDFLPGAELFRIPPRSIIIRQTPCTWMRTAWTERRRRRRS